MRILISIWFCFCLALTLAQSCPAADTKHATHAAAAKTPPVTHPTLGPIQDKWAIVIGINKFADQRIPTLKFAAKDAKDFADFLVEKQHFSRDHVLLLTDEQATEDSILDAIGDNWLPRRAFPNDLVLVFVSSHGSPREVDVAGENFLVAHDTKIDRLFSSGIRLEDLAPTIRKRTGCQRIVLLLDACNSGAADVVSKGLVRNLNFDINSFAGEGLIVISSSQADQRSWESARYQNGVFTKKLMEALETNGNSTTIDQAFKILTDRVQEEVRFDRKAFQQPLMKSKWTGHELVIGMTPTHPRSVPKELSDSQSAPAPQTQATPTPPEKSPISESTESVIIGMGSSVSPSASTMIPVSSTPPPVVQHRPVLGVRVEPISAELASSLSLPPGTAGVYIREVMPNSGAMRAGLIPGDIIQSIGNSPVIKPEDVVTAASSGTIGATLNLGILRNRTLSTVSAVLGDSADTPFTPVATVGGAIPPANASVPASTIQGTVQRNVQVLPEKICILPFAPPANYELTRADNYPRNFTTEDRTILSQFPVAMAQAVTKEVSNKFTNVIPLEALVPVAGQIQNLRTDQSIASGMNQLGQIIGARYLVVTTISKFSFAAKVNWSNRYQVTTMTQIYDAQTGKLLASIPKSETVEPWLGDSNILFTQYLDRNILPAYCKKLAGEIAKRLPRQ